jgi:putative transposase
MVRSIFAQPDADSVREQQRRIAAQLEDRFPEAAALLDEAVWGAQTRSAPANLPFAARSYLCTPQVLERSIDEINRQVEASAGSGDAAARLEGLVSAIQDEIAPNEAGFRSLMRLSIAQSPSDQPRVASIRGER